MGYTKLFSEIIGSTIWDEEPYIKIVWITMLAMKDDRHEVKASIPGLAHLARVSRDQCEIALEKFLSPDPDSRSQENEGRRIEEIDGGWHVLNGEKYRKQRSEEERKEYMRTYMQRYRKDSSVKFTLANVSNVSPTEQNRTDKIITKNNAIYSESFLEFWKHYPKRLDKDRCFKIWTKNKLESILPTILGAISKEKENPQWCDEEGRFIPNPTTWLNQKRWEKEIDVLKEKTQKEKIMEALNHDTI